MKTEFDMSIVIPMYNEAEGIVENLKMVVSVMDAGGFQWEMLVVDDGSIDNTCGLVQAAFSTLPEVRIIQHTTNKGYSEAVYTGLRAAQGQYVTFLDADLQFDPNDLVRFYWHAEKTQAPIVWGFSDKSNYSVFRKVVSKGYNVLARVLFGAPATIDVNSIKMIRRQVLNGFHYLHQKEALWLELLIHVNKNGHHIASLPIVVGERTHGTSHFHFGLVLQSLRSMLSLLWNRK